MRNIEIQNLSKSYGNKTVFSHLNLVLKEGKTTVITGPSGCGKTTLFRLLMGLEKPDEGNITGLEGLRKSAVFQEDRLLENLSVLRNIRLPLDMKSYSRREILSEIHQNLLEAGLDGIENKPVKELSGGMKRRVSVIRALMIPAVIYFFDEACNGLDEASKDKVLQLINRKTAGKTVLFITHDPAEAKLLSDPEIIEL